MKTTRYVPGSANEVNSAFQAGLAERSELSPLGGFFHVDVGVLNTTIELWSYADGAERDAVLARAATLAAWPPDLGQVAIGSESILLSPAPSNHPLAPGDYGGVYEFRIYHIVPGKMDEVHERWGEKIAKRAEVSPYLGAYFADDERAQAFVHIWAYDDAGHRQRVRAEVARAGIWPPGLANAGLLVRQESVLVIPTSFSPLH